MYEHRYKYRKQKAIMTVERFHKLLEISPLKLEQKAYLVLLWHSGARKSEVYERVKNDIEITNIHVIVDFHQRKKHGETVPPLRIPRRFYGVEEYLLPYIPKPKRKRLKTVYSYKTVKGKPVVQSKREREKWLFPHISSTIAWRICKKVLGQEFYPHYFRLRKLSKIGMNREKGTFTHLKAVSGIKSLKALEAYLGYDQEAQDEAMEISE
jgi:integrase